MSPIPGSSGFVYDCDNEVCRSRPDGRIDSLTPNIDVNIEKGSYNSLATNGHLVAASASITTAEIINMRSRKAVWGLSRAHQDGRRAAVTQVGLALFAFEDSSILIRAITWPSIRVMINAIELRNNSRIRLAAKARELTVTVFTFFGQGHETAIDFGPAGSRFENGVIGTHTLQYTASEEDNGKRRFNTFVAVAELYDNVPPAIEYLAYPMDPTNPDDLPTLLQAVDHVDGDVTETVRVRVAGSRAIITCHDRSNNAMRYVLPYLDTRTATTELPPAAPSATRDGSMELIIGTTISAVVVVVAIVLGAHRLRKSASVASRSLEQDMVMMLQRAVDQLAFDTDASDCFEVLNQSTLEMGQMLGEGSYSIVHQAKLKTEDGIKPVAVKMLKDSILDQKKLTGLVEEAVLVHSCRHRNIIPVHGIVGSLPPGLVMHLAQCDLRTWLRRQRQRQMEQMPDEQTLLLIFAQVLEGLSYLHQRRIVHRDIAARNVLLLQDRPMRVCLGDFGLTRRLRSDSEYYSASAVHALPFRWMSLETLKAAKFAPASDVWAVGVVGYELCTGGKTPYGAMGHAEVVAFLRAGKRLPLPEDILILTKLVELCWQPVAHRPTARQVLQELHAADPQTEESSL
eukprot:TRINITY_DN12300_c0_g1_i2.p1 TRINITY_DN12300_c0_g1~~TRINITY_DN12300_c0_g1_i2.p1  ORF type:complete len:627 (+),score=101.40 TRINITY_DN12300_c0_g1_i2:1679-3559(+)